jgi:hypothetical protein
MWLGFPADTLSQLGLKGLPRDAMLPIEVQGHLAGPKVKWLECVHKDVPCKCHPGCRQYAPFCFCVAPCGLLQQQQQQR